MNVAGSRMSLLRSSIAIRVWGVNMRTMNTIAAPIETRAWTSVSRCARSRSASSTPSSASNTAAASASVRVTSALTS